MSNVYFAMTSPEVKWGDIVLIQSYRFPETEGQYYTFFQNNTGTELPEGFCSQDIADRFPDSDIAKVVEVLKMAGCGKTYNFYFLLI